ncbi:hypothetical protein [Cellulomonas sp. PhB150]|uniref:hypothetical protein n=1 Tax=Cellulomonas sp. PhB150 TaxID=2485188 RepID=UPI000FB15689|nr:hypothetical protein [Cellulomonas sp. PhB150]ROS25851.1 hypothetical protein EDF34_2174 [Cellulomonas sp. PhB150]
MGWLGAMSLLGGLVGLIAIAWARLRWWTPRPEVFYRVEASRLRHVRAHRREYVLGELGLTGDAARSAIDEHLDDYRSKPIARHDAQIIAWIVRRCGGQARAVPDVERTDELAIG